MAAAKAVYQPLSFELVTEVQQSDEACDLIKKCILFCRLKPVSQNQMKIHSYCVLLVGFLLVGTIQAQSIEAQIQSTVENIYNANPECVGLMVHVESPNLKISLSNAAGFSDKGQRKELDADQPGLIASNIKTYVSATILKLVESNQLKIDQSIQGLLTENTTALFKSDNYDLKSITIQHLLSHTSGIANYGNADYIDFISENPKHRWTRDEQLARTIEVGDPLGPPGFTFSYTDANYLLLTEIIEVATEKPFYTAMRDLLQYDALGLSHTWMPTLEKAPKKTKPLIHQYWGKEGWDSYEIDISFDLYGGGGIACTPRELALFNHTLFTGSIVKNQEVLNLIYTEITTQDSVPSDYYLGIGKKVVNGITGFGHGGFWATQVVYFPSLNATISIYILDKDQKALKEELLTELVRILKQ